MRPDPRCPACDGKVSATAEWCMHCGRDFDAPVDANADGERVRGGGRAGRAGTAGVDSGGSGTDAGLGDLLTDDVDGRDGGTVTTAREGSGAGSRGRSGSGSRGQSGSPADEVGSSVAERDRASRIPDGPVDALVTAVAADEDRRELLVAGVPAVVWLLYGNSAGSVVALVGAALLALYLYTRETARETVAASAYGAGLLVAVTQVGRAAALAMRAGRPVAETLTAASGTLLFAVILIAAGAWIHENGASETAR